MKIGDLKEKRVTVMGLGLHGGGVGIILFLSQAGAKVTITDLKNKEELESSLKKLKGLKNIQFVFGQHRSEDFSKVDLVIKNPGVPWDNKHIKMALEKNIPVEIDSSLFFKLCKNPIFGITGTKGKTTTSSLIFEILKVAGKHPVKIGIGQISVLDKLKDLKKDSTVVFELSSWRLSALGRARLSPQVAVFTNFLPDHLNYYKTMDNYLKDKKYIFENQKAKDLCIVNWDNETLKKLEDEIPSQLIKFSRNNLSGQKGVFLENGKIFVSDGEKIQEILAVSDLRLRGEHNFGNIMAAIGATYFWGIGIQSIKKAVLNFSGMPHRLELVRKIGEVKYYNDTAATTPESAISGIKSFSEPIVLIAGGADKNLDVSELAEVILKKTKQVIFLRGQATDKILEKIKKSVPEREFSVVSSMEEAVVLAERLAEDGDIVLLSPGASSFGLFQNEFDRGDKFREAVANLK